LPEKTSGGKRKGGYKKDRFHGPECPVVREKRERKGEMKYVLDGQERAQEKEKKKKEKKNLPLTPKKKGR